MSCSASDVVGNCHEPVHAGVTDTLELTLPELIPAAVDAVMTIVSALIDNLPLLINAAIELVTALVEGIGMALAQLIPAAVSAVTQIEFFAIEEDSESKIGELADKRNKRLSYRYNYGEIS